MRMALGENGENGLGENDNKRFIQSCSINFLYILINRRLKMIFMKVSTFKSSVLELKDEHFDSME